LNHDWRQLYVLAAVSQSVSLRGAWAELPEKVLRKHDGLLDRVSYYFPIVPGEK
jgi:hypothetical protein